MCIRDSYGYAVYSVYSYSSQYWTCENINNVSYRLTYYDPTLPSSQTGGFPFRLVLIGEDNYFAYGDNSRVTSAGQLYSFNKLMNTQTMKGTASILSVLGFYGNAVFDTSISHLSERCLLYTSRCV